MQFNQQELYLLRQWFEAVQDLEKKRAPYLSEADYDLAGKIALELGVRPPKQSQ